MESKAKITDQVDGPFEEVIVAVEETTKQPKKNNVVPDTQVPKKAGTSATRKMMRYLKGEWWTFFWATIALLIANLGQLVIPYYVGVFVDAIATQNYDRVYRLTW